MSKVYKIRRRSDGLFSTGGSNPTFSKDGKLFKQGALTRHLAVIGEREFNARFLREDPYKDCEVVTFEMRLEEVGKRPVNKEK